MSGTISRIDVIKALDTGEPFHMVFVSCDRRRGTGGERITVDGWVKKVEPRPTGTGISPKAATPRQAPKKWVPILNPQARGQHPISVHFSLITHFNHQRVVS